MSCRQYRLTRDGVSVRLRACSCQRRSALAYEQWSATCDTLHCHTQVLGKLATALAPPEPQLQHTALRLTARGWETNPLPSPDGRARPRFVSTSQPSGGARALRRTRADGATAARPAGRRCHSRMEPGAAGLWGGTYLSGAGGLPFGRSRVLKNSPRARPM